MMADYVNCQDAEKGLWNKPESYMGIIRRREEEEGEEKNEYYSEGKEKAVYYNDSWLQELRQSGEATDSPSPAHSSDSLYDQISNPATTDSDDGYEVPVCTTDRHNRLNHGANGCKHTDQTPQKGGTDSVHRDQLEAVTAGKKAKYKPVPKRRKNKSPVQGGIYCLAKSDSSLDSVDMSSSPNHNPKKTLSRQKVFYQGRGQLQSSATEPRKKSQDCRDVAQGRHKERAETAKEKKKDQFRPTGAETAKEKIKDQFRPTGAETAKERKKDQFRPTGAETAKEKIKDQFRPTGAETAKEKIKDQFRSTGAETAKEKKTNRFRSTRTNSAASDKFEDALEYLPEDWAPAKSKGEEERKTASAGACTNYEDAWDLNPRLEAKLSSLRLMHLGPEPTAGCVKEGNYLEPWDSSRKQQELEQKLHQAAKGREGGGGRQVPLLAQSFGEQRKSGCDVRRSASQVCQSSQREECSGHSLRTSSSLRSAPGSLGGPVYSTDCLHNQQWYHGSISRTGTENLLRVCKDGSYLVRDSSDHCHNTLSIKSFSQIIHIQIEQSVSLDGSMRYILGHHSRAFPTIPSMIHHYTRHPMPIKGAQHTKLLYSVPHT